MSQEPTTFEDDSGTRWEIRPEADYKWHFVPAEGNDATRRIATPPPAADDPSDLDREELQRLLDGSIPSEGISEPLST